MENVVTLFLKARSGHTMNFRTGGRLCQCGHLFGLKMASLSNSVYTVQLDLNLSMRANHMRVLCLVTPVEYF